MANRREAILSLINHPAPTLNYKSGQFLGGILFSDQPLTERQNRWLTDLLKKHDLPAFTDGGRA